MSHLRPVILLFALAANVVHAQDESRLDIDDLLSLRYVSDPQLHPNGHWIAYVVTRNDQEADEETSQIFMVSRDGGETLQMTGDDYAAFSPRFSPDGRYLAFLAARGDDDAKTQVWTLDLRGGEAQAYTDIDQGVQRFEWSPSGERMLLVIKDKSASDLAAEAAEEAGEEPKPLPYVIDRLQFKEDGVPYLDRSRTHLYVVDGRNAQPVQLTEGDYDDSQPAWKPDGKEIAFVSNRTEEPDSNVNSDIWVVPAETADAPHEPRRLTENPGSDYAPAWSPDGAHIVYVAVTEPELIWYATNHLAIVAADGSGERVLTAELDRNVIAPKFGADANEILFIVENSAAQSLWTYDVAAGRAMPMIDGEIAIAEFVHGAGGEIVARTGTVLFPDELFLHGNGAPTQLTDTNSAVLRELDLARVLNVTFQSGDGTEIEGFVFLPPDYREGRRYPTVLRIHGGPVAQYDFSWNGEAQLFAAHGYVVVISNPRGSSGYGQDFSAALFAAWGVKDFEDVMAAVDYTIEQGYTDPDRLGVGGWSYGGILTNYVITKSDRFEAAISGASEVNYVANYGHDHYQYWWEAELGLPWESRENWERISPWNDVDKIVTPTLVIGGKEDWNVPIHNSEQLYQALRRRGVPTQLVVYPDEAHSITRPSFVRDRYQRYLDWYDLYLRGR